MRFMTTHPWRVLAALALGILLHWALGRWAARTTTSAEPNSWNRRMWIVLWVFLAVFYAGAYLTRPVYYAAYHGGSMGDNYLGVNAGVNSDGYVVPQHFYFPWVPAQVFKTAVRLNIVSLQDPLIL